MDLSLYLIPSVSVIFALIAGYLGGKWRLRNYQRQLDAFEEDLRALVERFNRRQARESMRVAREAKETEKELLERARLAAATEGARVSTVDQNIDPKAALRAKVMGKH